MILMNMNMLRQNMEKKAGSSYYLSIKGKIKETANVSVSSERMVFISFSSCLSDM